MKFLPFTKSQPLFIGWAMIIVLLFYTSGGYAGQNYETSSKYSGLALKAQTYQCQTNDLVAGGYWLAQDGTIDKKAYQSTEPTTKWRIDLKGNFVVVSRFSGATETLEAPEKFTFEVTPTGGLLFVSKERRSGFSPQIITIDPSNGSFVYTSPFVSFLYNRANVYYGFCFDYL